MQRFRAADRPALSWWTYRMRSRYGSTACAVASVEPSSTTTISTSGYVCARALSIASGR